MYDSWELAAWGLWTHFSKLLILSPRLPAWFSQSLILNVVQSHADNVINFLHRWPLKLLFFWCPVSISACCLIFSEINVQQNYQEPESSCFHPSSCFLFRLLLEVHVNIITWIFTGHTAGHTTLKSGILHIYRFCIVSCFFFCFHSETVCEPDLLDA